MLPQSWSFACWAVFLTWLAFTLWVNFPSVLTGAAANDPSSEIYELLGEYGTVSSPSGWPLPYMECTNAKGKTQHWLNYSPFYGLLDLVIAGSTLASVVVVMQTWGRKFSLRTLLWAIAIISILLIAGRSVYAISDHFLMFSFVLGIYLSPVWMAVILFAWQRFRPATAG